MLHASAPQQQKLHGNASKPAQQQLPLNKPPATHKRKRQLQKTPHANVQRKKSRKRSQLLNVLPATHERRQQPRKKLHANVQRGKSRLQNALPAMRRRRQKLRANAKRKQPQRRSPRWRAPRKKSAGAWNASWQRKGG